MVSFRSGNYKVRDVKGFMISYNGEKHYLYMCRDIIEILASDGDEEELEKLSRIEAYEESLKRATETMPKISQSLGNSKSYLNSMDEYYSDIQKFIERKQKEIYEKRRKICLEEKRGKGKYAIIIANKIFL